MTSPCKPGHPSLSRDNFNPQYITCLSPEGQLLIRKPDPPVSHHKIPVPGPVGQSSFPHPDAGPGTDFSEVKQNPGDRVEKLRFQVDLSWTRNRKFLAVKCPLVPQVPTLIHPCRRGMRKLHFNREKHWCNIFYCRYRLC